MKSRRACREAALQALYQCDTLGDFSLRLVQGFFSHFQGNEVAHEEDEVPRADPDLFCNELVAGVIQNLSFIDGQISLASKHWSIPRMSRIDRNILRIATYELAFRSDVPPRVSLNEAIEVAKRFGSDDSPMFVNGVLDRVASGLAALTERPVDLSCNVPLKHAVNQ